MRQLPNGWYITEIENVLKPQEDGKLIHQGWSPRCHVEPADEGEWGVLKTTAIQDGFFLEQHNKKLPLDKKPKERIEVKAGDLLMTNAGPRNRCGVTTFVKNVRSNLMLSGKMYRMRFDETRVYAKYIEFYLRTPEAQRQIDQRKTGMSESGLNLTQERFLSVPIVMCPYEEQVRIADKLESIFEILRSAQPHLEKVPQLLKRFRMSVLSAAVSGELTEEWRDANPSLEAVLSNNFIQSYDGKPLDDLPQGWGWVHFKSAAKIESNLVDPKLTPNDIHLAPNHIEPNTGRILELVTVEQDKVKSNKHRFYPGQIIYSKIRPYLNKVCSVDFEGVCSADMYPVKANINREYLLYVMLSDMFVYWTSQQQGRVVLPKINQKALNEIPVPVPSNEEQNEIARIVSELWAKADAVEKQYYIAKLRVDKLTQSILTRAFRGELFESFSDKTARVAQLQSEDVIDEQPTDREEITLEQADINSIQSRPTPKTVDDKSELLTHLKSVKKAMTAQQLFDSVSVETFKVIDGLFVELKRLLELNLIEKVGEGENCKFKAVK